MVQCGYFSQLLFLVCVKVKKDLPEGFLVTRLMPWKKEEIVENESTFAQRNNWYGHNTVHLTVVKKRIAPKILETQLPNYNIIPTKPISSSLSKIGIKVSIYNFKANLPRNSKFRIHNLRQVKTLWLHWAETHNFLFGYLYYGCWKLSSGSLNTLNWGNYSICQTAYNRPALLLERLKSFLVSAE